MQSSRLETVLATKRKASLQKEAKFFIAIARILTERAQIFTSAARATKIVAKLH